MKNVSELANDLATLYEELRAGSIDQKQAAEMNNTAGKLVRVYSMQLAYHALRGEAPTIPFLAAPVEMKKLGAS